MVDDKGKTYGKIEVKSNLFSLGERSINPTLKKDDYLPTL
jgi:hypothetical protein